MGYHELYASLSQRELGAVALRARLSVEDIRQEALLCCWQIACGRSDYDARCGSARRYIMGKLWGLVARESELLTVALVDSEDVLGEYAAPSILDRLVECEQRASLDRQAAEVLSDALGRYAGVSSTAVLMELGISSVRIAALAGITPQAVRQRVARERLRGSRAEKRSIRTVAP